MLHHQKEKLKMLFDTIDEIQKLVPAVSNGLSLALIRTHIETAENRWLKQLLGAQLMGQLQADYDANSTDVAHLALLSKARMPVAMLAMSLYAPYGQVQISDAGWRIIQTDTERPAYRYQIEKIVDALTNDGFLALEELVSFLESAKVDYPTWDYAGTHKHTINTASKFNEFININDSRLIYLKLIPHITRAEKNIGAMIAKQLMDELLQAIESDSLTTELEALLEKVQPAVAHSAYSKAIPALPVQVDGNRVTIFTNQFLSDFDPKIAPDSGVLAFLARTNREIADQYEETLLEFLNENAGDYPAFEQSSAFITPDDETGIDLEDEGGFLML